MVRLGPGESLDHESTFSRRVRPPRAPADHRGLPADATGCRRRGRRMPSFAPRLPKHLNTGLASAPHSCPHLQKVPYAGDSREPAVGLEPKTPFVTVKGSGFHGRSRTISDGHQIPEKQPTIWGVGPSRPIAVVVDLVDAEWTRAPVLRSPSDQGSYGRAAPPAASRRGRAIPGDQQYRAGAADEFDLIAQGILLGAAPTRGDRSKAGVW
jgi:hypothetical protein